MVQLSTKLLCPCTKEEEKGGREGERADCVTDHMLVIGRMRLKLKNILRKTEILKKYNIWNP